MRANACAECYWPSTFTPTCPNGPRCCAVLAAGKGVGCKGAVSSISLLPSPRGGTEPGWIGIRCFFFFDNSWEGQKGDVQAVSQLAPGRCR